MSDRVYLLLGALLIIGVGYLLWMATRYERKKRKEAEKKKEESKQEGIKAGLLNSKGQWICQACKMVHGEDEQKIRIAEYPSLITGRTFLDRVLERSNRLNAVSDKYVIKNDDDGGPVFCREHYRNAYREMEAFHAKVRTQNNDHNAAIHDDIYTMETGGLVRITALKSRQAQARLAKLSSEAASGRPLLDSSHEVISLPSLKEEN